MKFSTNLYSDIIPKGPIVSLCAAITASTTSKTRRQWSATHNKTAETNSQAGRLADRHKRKKLVDILPACTPSSRTKWMCRCSSCSWDALDEMMFCFQEKVLIFIHIPTFSSLFKSIFLVLERGLRVIPIVYVLLMICRGWLV